MSVDRETPTDACRGQKPFGLIPICGWCKNVRNDTGYRQSVEQYVHAHTDATFTHGVCPACQEKLKADIVPYPIKSSQEQPSAFRNRSAVVSKIFTSPASTF